MTNAPMGLLFVLLAAIPAVASSYEGSDWNIGRVHHGKLESDLMILNYNQEQSPAIQALFTTAYNSLGADSDATFAHCPEISDVCRKNRILHLGGPMLGALTSDGARVWVRTIAPAAVEVIVTVDGIEKRFGPVMSTVDSDLTAVVKVTGLKPSSRYRYRVTINKTPIVIPSTAVITTAPEPSLNSKVKIAFGADFHKTGFQDRELLNLVRTRNNAAMLLLGDLAVTDRNWHFGRHRSDYLLRDLSVGWQDLVSAVPVYASWDDHDYFNNDFSGIPEGYTAADRSKLWQVWQQSWNNPEYGFGDERGGIFFRTTIGPCDIIMLDTRSLREGDLNPMKRGGKRAKKKGGSYSYLGKAQMKWLEQQLQECTSPFVILSSGTMWSDYLSNGKDSWGVWDPAAREQIFSLIEKNGIKGVILISGDRHGARAFEIRRPAMVYNEFEVGSLGGHHKRGPKAMVPGCKEQLFGFPSLTSAFGEFEFDATLPDPEVTFRLVHNSGKILHKMTLKRSQLTPKKLTTNL